LVFSGTQSHIGVCLLDTNSATRIACARPAGACWFIHAGCRAGRRWTRSRSYGPSYGSPTPCSGPCVAGFTSMPAGGSSPPWYMGPLTACCSADLDGPRVTGSVPLEFSSRHHSLTTRAGPDTMLFRGMDDNCENELTEADDTAGAETVDGASPWHMADPVDMPPSGTHVRSQFLTTTPPALWQPVCLLDRAICFRRAGRIICRASRDLILRRATSFDRPILTSSGWPFLLLGNFCSAFAISTLDVLAHGPLLGSVQPLYASYIYVLFLPAPGPRFRYFSRI
jgi:hypothetical protein